jgi:hypothetical protein
MLAVSSLKVQGRGGLFISFCMCEETPFISAKEASRTHWGTRGEKAHVELFFIRGSPEGNQITKARK